MLKIGVTGGIGSGKSTVCNIFRNLGVPVFDSDARAKEIVDSDKEIQQRIRKEFGNDMFFSDGKMDRKRMAQQVFNDPQLLEKLNAIIHPVVAMKFNEFCEEHHKRPYVIKEAAILFETNSHQELDRIINVFTPRELRIKRLLKRDDTSVEKIERIMRSQYSDEMRNELADHIIVNENIDDLLPQVMELHELYLNKADAKSIIF